MPGFLASSSVSPEKRTTSTSEEQAMTRSRADQPATMSRQPAVEEHDRRSAGEDVRERLLAGIPVTERQLELAGGAATSVACTCP
jgi:hypothetical protein